MALHADQCTSKERIFALIFYGIEIILAQAQQAEVALEYVTVGNARSDREGRVYQCVDVDALQTLANQCQPGLIAQVLGQLFDFKVGHVRLHLLGETNVEPKPSISMGNQHFLTTNSRIQDYVKKLLDRERTKSRRI